MNAHLSPLRERYTVLMQNPEVIHSALKEGGLKARVLAAAKITQLRKIIGID